MQKVKEYFDAEQLEKLKGFERILEMNARDITYRDIQMLATVLFHSSLDTDLVVRIFEEV